MAVTSLGFKQRLDFVPGYSLEKTQNLIDQARFAMFSEGRVPTNAKKCPFIKIGADEWRLNPSARQTLTNIVDLERAAKNCCLSSRRVDRTILSSVQIPNLILAGDPSLSQAYGSRLGIEYEGGHFIYLPAQPRSEDWLVHDPLCLQGPARLSNEELHAFLDASIFGDIIGLTLG